MRMNRPRIVALTTLACLAWAPPLARGQGSGPVALAPEPVRDVGVVVRGEKIRHTFVVRNEGGAVLEITEVKPACGCTVANFDRTIAPGKQGKVHAEIETTSFRGPIAKTVQVFTNDPANPRLDLVIKANVKTLLEAEPGYVRFVAVQGEAAPPAAVTVAATDRDDLVVSRVESPFPFVRAAVREATEEERRSGVGGRQWRIEMTLDPKAPPGPLNDFAVVHTNHRGQPTLRVPVSGYVRPILTVTPHIADFGRREVEEPQTASLEIKNLGSKPVSLSEVASDLDGLEAAIEPVDEGRVYKLVLTLSPRLPKGSFNGRVTISTSSPLQPTLEVDVRGTVL